MRYDLFAAQDAARLRTRLLLVLFGLALIVILIGHVALFYPVAMQTARAIGFYRGLHPEATWVLEHRALLVSLAVGTLLAVAGWRARKSYRQFSDGERVAELLGARALSLWPERPSEQLLRNVTEEIAVAASLPCPRLYILDNQPGINAFAIGHDPRDGAVFVTDTALEELGRDGLQAVIAHEIGHLAAGDAELNARASAAITAIRSSVRLGTSLIGVFAGIFYLMFTGEKTFSQTEQPITHRTTAAVVVTVSLLVLALILPLIALFFPALVKTLFFFAIGMSLLSGVGLLCSRGLAIAVARQRERHADALALQLTRHPQGIADALHAVGGHPLQGLLLTPYREALRPFFFTRPDLPDPVFGWHLSAHPPPADRLRHVDPLFDGTFRPTARPVSTVETEPAVLEDRDARPSSRPLAEAESLLHGLPDPLLDAAHAPALAPLLVYTLLDSPAPSVRDVQQQVLDETGGEAEDHFARLVDAAAGLSQAHKLPLVEIALPALRRLAPLERARFLRSLIQLVRADGRTSLWEFALTKALEFGLREDAVRQTSSAADVRDVTPVVLAAVASAGHQTPKERAEAYAHSYRHLLPSSELFPPFRPVTSELFSRALDTLASGPPILRQRVLDAAWQGAHADRRVPAAQADLIRVIALACGLPSPLSSYLPPLSHSPSPPSPRSQPSVSSAAASSAA